MAGLNNIGLLEGGQIVRKSINCSSVTLEPDIKSVHDLRDLCDKLAWVVT